MQKPEQLFGRYIWFVNTLLQAGKGGISLRALSDKWLCTSFSEGKPLSRTTFNRYRDVLEEMFGINTDCHAGNYNYYISNPEILNDAVVQTWMLRTMTVAGILQSSSSLHNRIVLESMPGGQEYLQPIIDAMERNHIIRMNYARSFDSIQTILLKPYCLKVFRQRWYLVGRNTAYRTDAIRVYALDRILRFQETNKKFVFPTDFNPKYFFENDFGVYTGGKIKVEDIVIRAYGKLPHYLRTLPLHHSQQEVNQGEGFVDFSLHIRPTYDFMQELLSQADELEILSPTNVRKDFARILRNAARRNRTRRQSSDDNK